MPSNKTHAELVQQQIEKSSRDLGRVVEYPPIIPAIDDGATGVYEPSAVLTWRVRNFIESQTRCTFFDALISGFNRHSEFGWCALSQEPDDSQERHSWLDARHRWLNGCSLGELTTCSGYSAATHYVPHPKQFRSTSQSVTSSALQSERGKLADQALTQYYTAVYSVEIQQHFQRVIPLSISTPDSVGIFLSGHSVFNSDRSPNTRTGMHFTIPPDEWVRMDVTYYSPNAGGRIEVGENLTNYIDAWRMPPLPEQVDSFYSTFAYRPPGTFAKWSFALAYFTPSALDADENLKHIDIDWRAPNFWPNNWQRISVELDQNDLGAQVSGIWRVPHSEEIETRARAVNAWGDPGPWHPVSGWISAVGNVKPDELSFSAFDSFDVNLGVSQVHFHTPLSTGAWKDIILVSGTAQGDPYMEQALIVTAIETGDMVLHASAPLNYIGEGALISLGAGLGHGPYEEGGGITSELHMVTSVDGNDIYLDEPVINTWAAGIQEVRGYHVAKISDDDDFSLFVAGKGTYYYNVVARDFNGGITWMASGEDAWPEAAITIEVDDVTAPGEIPEQGIGRNFLRNGSFELPGYTSDGIQKGVTDEPLTHWYLASGGIDFGASGPASNYGPWFAPGFGRTGHQAPFYPGASTGGILRCGEHAGMQQDMFGLTWDRIYTISGYWGSRDEGGLYIISGLLGITLDLYEYDNTLRPYIDFEYGTLPAGASLLNSVTHIFETDTLQGSPPEPFPVAFRVSFDVTGASDKTTTGPLLNINVFYPPEIAGYHLNTGGAGGFANAPAIYFDDLSVTDIQHTTGIFDDDIDGLRFDWASIRTNRDVNTGQGDHLNIDREFGLNITRREDNPPATNRQTRTSLEGFSISGHMDLPRLVYWAPYVVSARGRPDYYGSASPRGDFVMQEGYLVVPSGRALLFDVRPTRTFENNSDIEVGPAGVNCSFAIPSGSAQYGGLWYDPGQHSVQQVNEVYYYAKFQGEGSFTLYRESVRPLASITGDTELQYIYVESYTQIVEPDLTTHTAYWHTCDVKIWETSAPFIASGVNDQLGVGNMGFVNRLGLTWFPSDTTSA
jgi:hypothetical protein